MDINSFSLQYLSNIIRTTGRPFSSFNGTKVRKPVASSIRYDGFDVFLLENVDVAPPISVGLGIGGLGNDPAGFGIAGDNSDD
jgi:hypothetical protein